VVKKTADVHDTGWKKWVQYVVTDIEISNGTCTVGLYADANSGNWGDLDDVELTMQ